MQIIDVDVQDGHGFVSIAVSNETNRVRVRDYFKETKMLFEEVEKLRAQRDAWKTEAEHQYGLLRVAQDGEMDYPVTGALDAYASGKYPALAEYRHDWIKELISKPSPAKPGICHKHG